MDEKFEIMRLLETTFDAELQFMVDTYKGNIKIPLEKSPQAIKSLIHTDINGTVFQPSGILGFPTIINKLRTGSRAEYLFTEESDYDDIYEIGGTVSNKDIKKPSLFCCSKLKKPSLFCCSKLKKPSLFCCSKSLDGFDGFYTIQDANRHFLYPESLKKRLGPLFLLDESKDVKKDKMPSTVRNPQSSFPFFDGDRTGASVPNGNQDFVIGMRLNEWPEDIFRYFNAKQKAWPEIVFSEISLFLITKGHPKSPQCKLEWRLSFSLVEVEIMRCLEEYQRKAYLIWKKSMKDSKVKVKSYHLKTVLMEVANEDSQQDLNIVQFKNRLEETLNRCYQERMLPNFFLPSQNLIDDEDQLPTTYLTSSTTAVPDVSDLVFPPSNTDTVLLMAKSYFVFVKCFGKFIVQMFERSDQNEWCHEENLRALHKSFLRFNNLYHEFFRNCRPCDCDCDCDSSHLQNYVNEMQKMPRVPKYIDTSKGDQFKLSRRPSGCITNSKDLAVEYARIKLLIDGVIGNIELNSSGFIAVLAEVAEYLQKESEIGTRVAEWEEEMQIGNLFELSLDKEVFGDYFGTLVLPHVTMKLYYEKQMKMTLERFC